MPPEVTLHRDSPILVAYHEEPAVSPGTPEVFPGKGVRTDRPDGPRAGVLVRISNAAHNAMRHIVAALPGARRLASVLEKKRLTRVGRFTDNGALQQEIARPLSEKEKKLQTIGDRQVGQQFYNDAMRRFKYRISGREMIDTRDWPATPHEREARVSAGFERLVEFCGGDEAEARRLTLFAHQGPAAPVLIALVNPDHAARLPDDSVGYVTPNSHYNTNAEQAEYNFSRSTSGRPQLDIRYSLVGRNTFNDLNTAKQTILSPDSVVRVHLRAELADDDTLQLLEPPSYRFYVRPDDFQKQYPPPTAQHISKASEGSDLLSDALDHGEKVGTAHEIHALRAVDRFKGAQEPTLLDAAAVVSACDGGPKGAAHDLIPSQARDTFQKAMRNARTGLVAAFDTARAEALGMAEQLYSQGRDLLTARSDWPSQYAPPATFAELVREATGDGGSTAALAALEAVERHFESQSPAILHFMNGLQALQSAAAGPDTFARAEALYQQFIPQPAGVEAAGGAAASSTPLTLSNEVAAEVRRQLDEQRQTRFAPDTFGDLGNTLAARIESHTLPGLIQAVQSGEL